MSINHPTSSVTSSIMIPVLDAESPLPTDSLNSQGQQSLAEARADLRGARGLINSQRVPSWFWLHNGVASPTAVSQILGVDARWQIIKALLDSTEPFPNVGGLIRKVIHLNMGVSDGPQSYLSEIQAKFDEDQKGFIKCCGDVVRQGDFLRRYTSEYRAHLDYLHSIMNSKVSPDNKHLPFCSDLTTLNTEQLNRGLQAFDVKEWRQLKTDALRIEALSKARADLIAKLQLDLFPTLLDTTWSFPTSVTTENMRNGHVAKEQARPELRKFLMRLGAAMGDRGVNPFRHVTEVVEQGLVEVATHPYAVTSVDGSFLATSLASPSKRCHWVRYCWENKALFTAATVGEAERLVGEYGMYSEAHFDVTDTPARLKTNIDLFGNRKNEILQVIHHAAVTDSPVIYSLVDGKEGKFLRVVRVSLSPAFRRRHLDTVQFVMSQHVPYTFNPNSLERLPPSKAKIERDDYVGLLLSRQRMRQDGARAVKARMLPGCARTWKKWKSGVDAQSKDMIGVRLSQQGTHRKLILEVLNIAVVGIARLFKAQRVWNSKDGFETRDHLMRKINMLGATREVIREGLREFKIEYRMEYASLPLDSVARVVMQGLPDDPLYRPADPNWETEAKFQLNNVMNTAAADLARAFNDGVLRSVRMNNIHGTWMSHRMTTATSRRSCVLCCMSCVKYHQDQGKIESSNVVRSTVKELTKAIQDAHPSWRQGYKTDVSCSCCRVHLCNVARPLLYGSDISCWDFWHTQKKVELQHPFLATVRRSASAAGLPFVHHNSSESAKKRRKRADSSKSNSGSY